MYIGVSVHETPFHKQFEADGKLKTEAMLAAADHARPDWSVYIYSILLAAFFSCSSLFRTPSFTLLC